MNLSLRQKLLIAASLMLIFPLAGYRYVRGMEEFLRQDQSRAVLATARALATALQTRVELFHTATANPGDSTELYIQPLTFAPVIDGYDQDWEALALPRKLDSDRLTAGRYRQYLYLLLGIRDPSVHFSTPQANGPPSGDFLKLLLMDYPGYERSWLLAAAAPGRLLLNELSPPRGAIRESYPDDRLQAALQLHSGGYVVELRIPAALLGTNLAIEIHNEGTRTRRLPVTGSYVPRFPSQAISRLLENLGSNPGQRIWVTDRQHQVLARNAAGPTSIPRQSLPALLRLLLPKMETDPLNLSADTRRLNGPEIDSALAGVPASRWRQQPDVGRYRLSAAYPVRKREQVVGAVVVEQDAQEILALRIRALAELLVSSLLSFAVAGIGLLLVAGSMVRRLRQLSQAAAHSIDSHGRVRGQFQPPPGTDEISELGRSFATLFERLAHYNQYLEQLARRLSHELRTPLAIIRSSLDNLALSQNSRQTDSNTGVEQGEIYQQRARQGVERLETLIKRMAEASRLEQALDATELECIDAVQLIGAAVAAQQQAWPNTPIEAQQPQAALRLWASPDLLLQALDKLLANARDFSHPGQPIRVSLRVEQSCAIVAVENFGPALPPGDPGHLFDSMISYRPRHGGGSGEPHLGLGLYVVRLVAQCHGGAPFAANLADGRGVRLGFTISTRLQPPASSPDRQGQPGRG